MTTIMDPRQWGLRDHLREGWRCTCGERLWPDCDMSAASVAEEFQRHLIKWHGCSEADIDVALGLGNVSHG